LDGTTGKNPHAALHIRIASPVASSSIAIERSPIGRLMTMPNAPSLSCRSIRITVRAKRDRHRRRRDQQLPGERTGVGVIGWRAASSIAAAASATATAARAASKREDKACRHSCQRCEAAVYAADRRLGKIFTAALPQLRLVNRPRNAKIRGREQGDFCRWQIIPGSYRRRWEPVSGAIPGMAGRQLWRY